ncbi:segregation and condensation protein A [Anaerorhabdus furcosa]|uniref:Segregation and condensation protein A n=1 Tax=Anaerorhabdus furcosa TaxID=118967 RepID=A0A1T4QC08_9FIRM|nr:segregation/condensation protein A [Anaerorhabdus furcosa]SKA01204.1 condensin subunit ScpA [Anaerorhabdus furcosa]
MTFTVAIDQFEGPLDLMLHLIKEQELDLFDLDISVLTDQYLTYLNHMEDLHLEVASEYLLELATLIEYKSKKILPKDQSLLEDEFEEDPKDRLVRRLLEYQQFKEVSEQLSDLYHQRAMQMSKPISIEVDEWTKPKTEDAPIDGSPYDLVKAMNKCLRRLQLSKPIETKFTAKELSMEDRSLQIKARLRDLPDTFSFETLIEDCNDMQMVIVTFLSILDLARQHTLVFTIDENETIWFKRG